MPIERALLDILACPIDKQGLLYFDDERILYNPRLRRIYRAADEHLVMVADRAEPVAEHEHERLLKRARHGDAIGTSGLRVDGRFGAHSVLSDVAFFSIYVAHDDEASRYDHVS